MLDGRAPNIVLADYRLQQGETGIDVITAIRATFGRDLLSLIFTGDTDPKLLRSIADGDIMVLHKPLELEALSESIEKMMTGKGR